MYNRFESPSRLGLRHRLGRRSSYPEYGIKHLFKPPKRSALRTALPIALQHNYTQVALGITKSTDEHNLIWDKTGEEINYLWGSEHRRRKAVGRLHSDKTSFPT